VGLDNGDGGGQASDGVLQAGEVDSVAYVCKPTKRVFVSSAFTNGNIGGLAGADAFCQNLADNAKLGGIFKAWLSDSVNSPSTRFVQSPFGYTLVDGKTQVASSWSSLTTSQFLLNRIQYNERGNFEQTSVWTGTAQDGTTYGSGDPTPYTCGDWTSNSSSSTGLTGTTRSNDVNWTRNLPPIGCSAAVAVYCFEQ
jgi:hypothetical protein